MTRPVLIPDLLRERAAAEPRRTALAVDGRGAMSYGDWENRSNVVARNLIRLGVAVGDRVATFFENAEWLDFAVAYFGVLKAGAVAVPSSTAAHLSGSSAASTSRMHLAGQCRSPNFSSGRTPRRSRSR